MASQVELSGDITITSVNRRETPDIISMDVQTYSHPGKGVISYHNIKYYPQKQLLVAERVEYVYYNQDKPGASPNQDKPGASPNQDKPGASPNQDKPGASPFLSQLRITEQKVRETPNQERWVDVRCLFQPGVVNCTIRGYHKKPSGQEEWVYRLDGPAGK